MYWLVFLMFLPAILGTLALQGLLQPAQSMVDEMLAFLSDLLAGVGFDRVLVTLGIGGETTEDGPKPSAIIGHLLLIAIMLCATIEAVRLLGFGVVAGHVAESLVFAGHVLLGLVVFGVGLYLANLAAKTVSSSSARQASQLAFAARVSITVLTGAMALREMGLADEIITLAFGLLLAAIAVAAALAFGRGCRDLASRGFGHRGCTRRSRPSARLWAAVRGAADGA